MNDRHDLPHLNRDTDLETCQGCKAEVEPWLICEHTDESPGPCCVDLCCPRLHGDDYLRSAA